MNPKVSIVVPVYNREVLIRRTLDSILSQSFKDFECIVSDNHSTDGTHAVLVEYADHDSRIKILSQPQNVGPVKNWLAGVAACRGEFVKILFSDDWMESDCLAEALEVFEGLPSIGFVYFHAEIEGSSIRDGKRESRVESGFSFLWRSLVSHRDAPVSPSSALFRREDVIGSLYTSIETLDGSDYLVTGAGPDQAIYLDAADNHEFIFYINKTMIHYGINKCSITVDTGTKRPGHLLRNYFMAQLAFLERYSGRRTLTGRIMRICIYGFLVKLFIRYRLIPKMIFR